MDHPPWQRQPGEDQPAGFIAISLAHEADSTPFFPLSQPWSPTRKALVSSASCQLSDGVFLGESWALKRKLAARVSRMCHRALESVCPLALCFFSKGFHTYYHILLLLWALHSEMQAASPANLHTPHGLMGYQTCKRKHWHPKRPKACEGGWPAQSKKPRMSEMGLKPANLAVIPGIGICSPPHCHWILPSPSIAEAFPWGCHINKFISADIFSSFTSLIQNAGNKQIICDRDKRKNYSFFSARVH